MATFSFGSGVTPGAPGTYINERAGNVATAGIASFNTVYMLVETEEDVPVTRFPFNRPIPISSLSDYRVLVNEVPETRIPLLSYNCVDSFFANSQVGDLRVIRVGTPNQIVEIEILPSGLKVNDTGIPSPLTAGSTVYVQLLINNQKLVAGDGSTGYTSDGEWLGVPVVIPVDFIAGDEVNNRRISSAIANAIAAAIESNPSVRNSVYVRDFGLVNDLLPESNSENGYITLAASTYDGSVSVQVSQILVGANFVLMGNAYDIENVVGLGNSLERVPQDYIQCIDTAFDGQSDQGYLITPTAYAQFDAEGRAKVGAAAAAHCEKNEFKWLALADVGPLNITDVNKYKEYVPHAPTEDLITNSLYLVDNAIYKWVGNSVTYDRLKYQTLVPGYSAKVPVQQSVEQVAPEESVGLKDLAKFTVGSLNPISEYGVFQLDSNVVWPVEYQIQEVTLSDLGADFTDLLDPGENSKEVYIVAPPLDSSLYGPYPSDGVDQFVFIARTAGEAVSVLTEVTAKGGTAKVIEDTTAPSDCYFVSGTPEGSTAAATYVTSQWDLNVEIDSQTSNLIRNLTDESLYVNTLHLPGTLQNSTQDYRLSFISRTILEPSDPVTGIKEVESGSFVGAAKFPCVSHGLVNGQRIYFTQPILRDTDPVTTMVKATTKTNLNAYYVKVLDNDNFLLATSSSNYLASSFIPFSGGVSSGSSPTIFYSTVRGGNLTSVNLSELSILPVIRGRKYGFASGAISQTCPDETAGEVGVGISIYLNSSSQTLGEERIYPYGENETANWLPDLQLGTFGSSDTSVANFLCVPTVEQSFSSEAYMVPAIDPIEGGSYTSGDDSIATLDNLVAGQDYNDGNYLNVPLEGGTGTGATANIVVSSGEVVTVTLVYGGQGYTSGDTLTASTAIIGPGTLFSIDVDTLFTSASVYSETSFVQAMGFSSPILASTLQDNLSKFRGVYFTATSDGETPDGNVFSSGDRLAVVETGSSYGWAVIPPDSQGGDLTTASQVCHGTSVEFALTAERTPPDNLWRFEAVTSTEIISDALRGIGFNGDPQAEFIESGVSTVNLMYEDSQRYSNPFGFIAFYGPYVENAAGQAIPASPYVTGIAVRRYRAEGFQFPPAGVKYQLADANGVQIAVNSSQQNLLNPDGCNVLRSLPGYPNTAVFVWGGRTRINKNVPDQRKFQFVNTRVIQNVVFGSLRNAFDSQIFSVVDGFGVVFNQIVSIGNSVLSQLYLAGALFGQRPSDAFQIICDERINPPEDLENGIVNVKVFDTPVPTLERIQLDLIRVSIGQMQKELDSQGLGQ